MTHATPRHARDILRDTLHDGLMEMIRRKCFVLSPRCGIYQGSQFSVCGTYSGVSHVGYDQDNFSSLPCFRVVPEVP